MKPNAISNRWFILPAVLICLLLSAIPLSGQTTRQYQMGWEEWTPYQFKNSKNELTGLDIDLVQAIMAVSNIPIVFKEMPWKRTLEELKSGRIDMAAGASMTDDRKVYSYFSDAYRTESAVLYVKKGKRKNWNFRQIKDILNTNFQLCTTRGYYYGEDFEQLKKNKDFMTHLGEVTSESQCYMMLKRDYIDGFIADPISATSSLRREKMLDEVEVILTIYSDDIYIMFSKQSTPRQFVQTFNNNLQELKRNGKYFEILGNYLTLRQKPSVAQPSEPPPPQSTENTPQSKELSEAAKAFNALRLEKYLKEGHQGKEVSYVQIILKGLGYYKGPINGYYTSDVASSVRDFQIDSNLIPDGIVGPLTYRAFSERI